MKKWLIILLFPLIASSQQLPFQHSVLFTPHIDTAAIVYGYHGLMNFSSRPLSNAEVLDSLSTLDNFHLFRWPGGTLANTWQWQTGIDSLAVTSTPVPLTDVAALYNKMGGSVDIVFDINICTRPLQDQLNMLAFAAGLGIPIKYVEAGNEVNIETSLAHTIFPTALAYADTCAIWMAAIKAVYPNVLFGVVGENKPWSRRWNDTVLAINPDAIITHLGPQACDFVTDSIADFSKLETNLMQQWNNSGFGQIYSVPAWCTEFNYNFDIACQMNQANQIAVTLFMIRRVTELLSSTNKGGRKLMCVRGIEGSAQGAFLIGNSFIRRQATAYAMSLFIP